MLRKIGYQKLSSTFWQPIALYPTFETTDEWDLVAVPLITHPVGITSSCMKPAA